MADEDMDGLLSQDDINEALQQAGYSADAQGDSQAEGNAGEQAGGDDSGELSQADIDAALAGAGGADEGSPDAGGDAAAAAEPAEDTRVDASGRPFDEVAAAMAAAIEAEAGSGDTQDSGGAAGSSDAGTGVNMDAVPLDIPNLVDQGAEGIDTQGLDLLRDVELNVKIELGRSRMLVDDVLRLGDGSVVELDKLAGDPVDVFVNERLIARGEVLVLNDNFCVRINEIITPEMAEEE